MRRISVFIALLALTSVSRGQEEKVQVEETTSVVVVLSGLMPEAKAFDAPLSSINDIAVSNDDSFHPVQILGRRYGPFDGPQSDNFDFANQIWSLLNSGLRSLDDFQSRIATAMALRCSRMRQHALENILREHQYAAVEPGFMGTASTAANIVQRSSSTSSSRGTGSWVPGIVDHDDITVEEPEFWDRFEQHNHNNDNINDFIINDRDVFYLDFEANDDPSPVKMPPLLPAVQHLEKHFDEHHEHEHFHHDHDEDDDEEDEEDEHHHDHHDHHDGDKDDFHHHGGFKTKPLFFNPFEQNHHHNNEEEKAEVSQSRPPHQHPVVPLPDIIFSTTVYTYFYDSDDGSTIPDGFLGEDGDDIVNWQLWNEDGSLNTGLLLFIALCAACAVVWSALLLQCVSMGYAWVMCRDRCNRGQFMFLGGGSDSESEDDDEEGGIYGKEGFKKQVNGNIVVIAAEYTTTDNNGYTKK